MAKSLATLLIYFPFRLLGWLLFCPSAWKEQWHQIDRQLPTNISLAQLNGHHWLNKHLWKAVILPGLVLLPGYLLIGAGLLLWFQGNWSLSALAGIAYGVVIGWLVALMVSAAAGIIVAAAGVVTFTLFWNQPTVILMDAILGSHFALIFGTCSAVVVHVLQNVGRDNRVSLMPGQIFRQLGGFLIALLVSLVLFYISVSTTSTLIDSRSGGNLGNNSISLAVAFIPATLLGVATGWHTHSWRRGLRVALLLLVGIMLWFGDSGQQFESNPASKEFVHLVTGITSIIYVMLLVLPFVLVERLAGAWAGAIAGGLGTIALYPAIGRVFIYYAVWDNTVVALVLVTLGLTMHYWRPGITYPFQAAWNTILLRAAELDRFDAHRLLLMHTAFWDELQFLRFFGLEDHLVLLAQQNPEAGREMIEQISRGRQSWAAQVAQIELDARQLEACTTVEQIADIHWQLSNSEIKGPASALLTNLSIRSRDVDAAIQQISLYNQRVTLNRVQDALNALFREITRSSEPAAKRFAPIIQQWELIIAAHIRQLASTAEVRQEIPNPYVVGQPLTRQEESFVGRTEITARIEQLVMDPRHPPLLLYGQRRMGKTSLLYNLRWMLPSHILPLLVDLQGTIALSESNGSFVYNFLRQIQSSAAQQGVVLPVLNYDVVSNDPFRMMEDWLDQLEKVIVTRQYTTVLFTLDEFEALDSAFQSGQLDSHKILSALRHNFQHRLHFKFLLAGSHTIDEFQRWSHYLINATVLHLGYLHPDEAEQLITRPIKEFPLTYAADACQTIKHLTRGHPHLVQLLCREIVNLKNEQSVHLRNRVTIEDVESSAKVALQTGSEFFSNIKLNQIDDDGRKLLHWLSQNSVEHGLSFDEIVNEVPTHFPLQQALHKLLQREIIEEQNGNYRFQVRLIRDWFAKQ